MTQDDVASIVPASAAAARAFAPDVRCGLRRLMGAGVRLGAASLIEQQQPAARPEVPARLDEEGGVIGTGGGAGCTGCCRIRVWP